MGSKSRVSLSLVEEGGVVEDEDEELIWSACSSEIVVEIGALRDSSASTISPVPWAAMVDAEKEKDLAWLRYMGRVWERVIRM